jgi:hypothetical protein
LTPVRMDSYSRKAIIALDFTPQTRSAARSKNDPG